jgi:exonuclease III
VALIFKSKIFKLIDSEPIRIRFPDDPTDKTRDILHVTLLKDKKDTLHFIVNHFPSRKGGTEISEPKRIYAAQQTRRIVDSLLKHNYQARIILMGDFNDEPQDRSIRETLRCKYKKNEVSWDELYNPMMDLKEKGMGTIMYRKNYELIDQFMMSASLLYENDKMHYITNSVTIYMPEYLVEPNGAFKGSPFRTYGGQKYLGGYSDHFPIFMKISY